ncbi:MAG: thioredoxin [Proteiniphilum sp.]|nr:thioredoxin [Proteiniphilum sp.]
MQTFWIIIGVLVVAFVFYIYMMQRKIKNSPMVPDHENIITLTAANFKHQTKNRVILIDFWAGWCAPCRMMAPVLNEVAEELAGEAFIGKVDIEQHQSLAGKYNIRSIPTMIILKNGVEVNRVSGVKNKDFLLKQILNALN